MRGKARGCDRRDAFVGGRTTTGAERAGGAFCLASDKSTLKCSTVLISNLRFDNYCFPTFVFMGC